MKFWFSIDFDKLQMNQLSYFMFIKKTVPTYTMFFVYFFFIEYSKWIMIMLCLALCVIICRIFCLYCPCPALTCPSQHRIIILLKAFYIKFIFFICLYYEDDIIHFRIWMSSMFNEKIATSIVRHIVFPEMPFLWA